MFAQLYVYLQHLIEREEGQDLAEYAFLLLLIAIVVIVAVTALGTQISTVFSQISSALVPS
jgi:pilus assembly protein Flp/PilA